MVQHKFILDLRIHCLLGLFVPFNPIFFFIIPSSRHHIAFLRALRNGGSKSQNTKQFGRKFFGKPKCATFVEGVLEKF